MGGGADLRDQVVLLSTPELFIGCRLHLKTTGTCTQQPPTMYVKYVSGINDMHAWP